MSPLVAQEPQITGTAKVSLDPPNCLLKVGVVNTQDNQPNNHHGKNETLINDDDSDVKKAKKCHSHYLHPPSF